jgi:hypothetical protein
MQYGSSLCYGHNKMSVLQRNDPEFTSPSRTVRVRFQMGAVLSSALFFGMPVAFASSAPFRVVVPQGQTPQERAATTMLVEEAARRTVGGKAAEVVTGPIRAPSASSVVETEIVVLANRAAVPSLLPANLAARWHRELESLHATGHQATGHAEAFSIVTLPGRLTIIAGNDDRGELFGAGWLLRHIRFSETGVEVPPHLLVFEAPDKAVRGHQIGYRFKNNTYDAWTLTQFEQGIRDLAIFGTNTIQLIAPVSDDQPTSPLFPAPALDTLLGISKILAKYGLDCDLYYPEIRKNYTDPAAVDAELKDFEALVRAMPRLDALYVPGGDPGHTAPEVLFPLLAREAEVLHRYHPAATIWVSAQGFDRDRYEKFYKLLDAQPPWLTGVFFGPQSRDSFFTQRKRIPARYAMQFYPDIAHTMHAQFPVPEWDPIFALTEGREPVCPRPAAFDFIYHHFESLHSGFVTYSEGVNDDVNKIVWSQLGWSSKTPVDTILSEYARFFLHREGVQQELAVSAIKGLEEDWRGPLEVNPRIPRTVQALETLEQESTPLETEGNSAWEMLLYRGTYDDYLQRKLRRERKSEAEALAALDATGGSSADRVAVARKMLDASVPDATERSEHDRLFTLAGVLFHDIGIQLSVKLYGASNWERGANLDRVDTPLIESAWLNHAMDDALKLPDERARRAALHGIAHWSEAMSGAMPGAIYDDLGDPGAEPHLVRGVEWQRDPEMYEAAIDGIADRTLADGWRLSWLDYAETLYENRLELKYSDLDPRRSYRVRVTYAGEDYALPLRLVANGSVEIHPARLRKSNPETVEFAIPDQAVADGKLSLSWIGPEGSGGSGRGRQVAEVWLLPQ